MAWTRREMSLVVRALADLGGDASVVDILRRLNRDVPWWKFWARWRAVPFYINVESLEFHKMVVPYWCEVEWPDGRKTYNKFYRLPHVGPQEFRVARWTRSFP